jgi:hypothetical protein
MAPCLADLRRVSSNADRAYVSTRSPWVMPPDPHPPALPVAPAGPPAGACRAPSTGGRTDLAADERTVLREVARVLRPGGRFAGLTDIEIRPTRRVHTHAASAIVRARRPWAREAPTGEASRRARRARRA